MAARILTDTIFNGLFWLVQSFAGRGSGCLPGTRTEFRLLSFALKYLRTGMICQYTTPGIIPACRLVVLVSVCVPHIQPFFLPVDTQHTPSILADSSS